MGNKSGVRRAVRITLVSVVFGVVLLIVNGAALYLLVRSIFG
jgi:hypothetical protein